LKEGSKQSGISEQTFKSFLEKLKYFNAQLFDNILFPFEWLEQNLLEALNRWD
jgi:hypothetical protein